MRNMSRLLLAVIFLVGYGEACQVLKKPVQSGCEYDNVLKLTSRPNNLIVEKKNCSAVFVKTEWRQVPLLQMDSTNREKTYTVIAIDPDAPFHEHGEYYLHWLVSNIKGDDLITGDFSTGNTITEYKGPGPVINTGLHRYIFLVFEEEKVKQVVRDVKERRRFRLLDWLDGQKDKLCGPVAGVQFRTQY